MLDKLTKDHFEKYLNSIFSIQFQPEINLDAELIGVKGLGGDTDLERQPFSITLRTDQKDQYYSQATFVVKHPEMGDLTLFLSPLGPDKAGMLYEGVFS